MHRYGRCGSPSGLLWLLAGLLLAGQGAMAQYVVRVDPHRASANQAPVVSRQSMIIGDRAQLGGGAARLWRQAGVTPSDMPPLGARPTRQRAPVTLSTTDGTMDQLADYLINGFWEWAGGSTFKWNKATITYSFDSGWTTAEQNAAADALRSWSDVTNLTFSKVGSGGNISFIKGNDGAAWSSTTTTAAGIAVSSEVSIDTSVYGWDDLATIWWYGHLTLVHELGHCLGLGHQGPYNGTGSYAHNAIYTQDTMQYTVMSYFDASNTGANHGDHYGATPLLTDHYAIQKIYGQKTSTQTGATVYGYHSTASREAFDFTTNSYPVVCPWDAGGTDTIDLSSATSAVAVDLRQGYFGSCGGMTKNLSVPYGVVIENAIGGAGNDSLTGNDADNSFTGGKGNDTIDGQGGANTAIYTGTRSQYNVTVSGSTITVADTVANRDGTDSLTNIQWLRFSDGTVAASGSSGADLSVTITDGQTTATPGTAIAYSIVVSNLGTLAVTGAKVTDTFPGALSGVTYTATATGGATGFTASGTGNLNETVNLPVGSTITYTVRATISASATGTLSDTVTVAAPSGVTDTNPANNSATDTDTLTPTPSGDLLQITVTDGGSTAVPGSTVTYTIVASNVSSQTITGARIADTFPSVLSSVTYTAVAAGGATGFSASGSGHLAHTVTMPAASTITYTVHATIAASATGQLSNTATITPPSGTTDPVTANNTATDTDTLTPQADLAVTVSASASSLTAGSVLSYTVTVTNAGPSNAGSLVLTDVLPAGVSYQSQTQLSGPTLTLSHNGNTVSDTASVLAAGASAVVQIGTLAKVVPTVTNDVTVTGSASDPNSGNNAASVSTTITPSSVSAAQSALVAAKSRAAADGSEAVQLTITAKDAYGNAVSGVAASQVRVTSVPATGVTITQPATATNASGVTTATVTGSVAQSVRFTATIAGTTVTQTATVSFAATTADASRTTLAISPASATADGASALVLTLTVLDSSGTPLAGVGRSRISVQTTTSLTASPATLVWQAETTDSAGKLRFSATATRPQSVTWQVTVDQVSLHVSGTFTPRLVSAANSAVVIAPSRIAADGQQTAVLTVTLRDAAGLPVEGATVTGRRLLVKAYGDTAAGDGTEYTAGHGLVLVSLGATSGEGGQVSVTVAASQPGQWALRVKQDGVTLSSVVLSATSYLDLDVAAGTQFVSLPLLADADSFAGLVNQSGVVARRWDPAAYAYALFTSGTAPRLGEGFWLTSSTAFRYRLIGEGSSGDSVTVTLSRGWNAIGNPYSLDLPWLSAGIGVLVNGQAAGTLATGSLWRTTVAPAGWVWQRSAGSYALVLDPNLVVVDQGLSSLPRLSGMWVLALTDGVSLVLPAPSAAARPVRRLAPSQDWTLRLSASQNGQAGQPALVGCASGLSAALSLERPPGDGTASGARVAIVGSDGQSRAAGVIQPALSGTAQWTAEVTSRTAGETVLSWAGLLRQIPRGLLLEMTDLDTGTQVVLNTHTAYRWTANAAGGRRRFRLTARYGNLDRAQLTSVTAAVTRGRGMTIVVALTAPAELSAIVKGPSGHIVRQLPTVSVGAGQAGLSWDGYDDSGHKAPRGSYLIEVTATSANGAVTRAVRWVTIS